MPVNGVLLQAFHWYTEPDGTLWRRLAAEADALAARGFSAVWLPPAFKGAAGGYDVGYGVYDLYDLGEFDQKGTVRTRYGTKDEYLACVAALRGAGLSVYADIVFNHRLGADEREVVRAFRVDPADHGRTADEPDEVHAWTAFHFPGRAGTYSDWRWRAEHFTAFDHEVEGERVIFKIDRSAFEGEAARDSSNLNFLMGCHVHACHPDVQDELRRWGAWFLDGTRVDGFRFDAAKHVDAGCFVDWLHAMQAHSGRELFSVGEYWSNDVGELVSFLQETGGSISLFDVPLHTRLHAASEDPGFDLRTIYDGTLVAAAPMHAVTFVDTHDTQPLQSCQSPVADTFKTQAYALILLREAGYPCVFAADDDGAAYEDDGQQVTMGRYRDVLDRLLQARQRWAWGPQVDRFDHPHLIGWARQGDDDHPGGLVVVLSRGEGGALRFGGGQPGQTWVDVLGAWGEHVTFDEQGEADFPCPPDGVCVWVPA